MAENLSVKENNARFTDYPYDLRRDWWVDMQKRKLASMCSRIRPSESVLDVGCNSGYIVEFLPAGCTAYGVDLSPSLVAKAIAAGMDARVAPAERLPFKRKSIDVITCSGLIEYPFDPSAVMREMARVARRSIIITFDHELGTWGAHRIAAHAHMVRSYTEAAARALLAEVGTAELYDTIYHGSVPQHVVYEVVLPKVTS